MTERIASPALFGPLDFIYMPSRDVAADAEQLASLPGAQLIFAIEAFDARVAMVRLGADPRTCWSPTT